MVAAWRRLAAFIGKLTSPIAAMTHNRFSEADNLRKEIEEFYRINPLIIGPLK